MTALEVRPMLRSDLIASLEAANASIARGEGRVMTRRSMQNLAKEAKQRLRRRLAAEQESVMRQQSNQQLAR